MSQQKKIEQQKNTAVPTFIDKESNEHNARERLFLAASSLFLSQDYDRVSVRAIARQANVDPALIRYYFGNKAALFESVLIALFEPLKHALASANGPLSFQNLRQFMLEHKSLMTKNPQLPKMMVRLLLLDETNAASAIMRKVMKRTLHTVSWPIFSTKPLEFAMADGVDPDLAQLSMVSLMVFPFIASKTVLSMQHLDLSDAQHDALVDHNLRLLSQGILI